MSLFDDIHGKSSKLSDLFKGEDENKKEFTFEDIEYIQGLDNLERYKKSLTTDTEIIGLDDEDEELSIDMPYKYNPMMHQQEYWNMLNFDDEGNLQLNKYLSPLKHEFLRMIFVWHRRAGKDLDTWNRFLYMACVNPGIYYYFLPTASQARKVIFDGATQDHTRFIDFLPKAYMKGDWVKNEMKCELQNGSIIQILGSDNYDRIVGTNPKGVVFSEWSLCNPAAWTYIRPILRGNGGFAWFVYTPRGKNHGYTLLNNAQKPENQMDWTVSVKTIDDTSIIRNGNVERIFTKEDYEQEIRDGMEESKAKQEYYCDFDAPVKGSYYSPQMNLVYNEGRDSSAQLLQGKSVEVYFDIGMSDKTAMTFVQINPVTNRPQVIHFHQNDGHGIEYYSNYIKKFELKNNVVVTNVHFPHDMAQREFSTGKSRLDAARKIFDAKVNLLPKLPVQDGIDCVRRTLNKCDFDSSDKGVAELLEALGSYQKEFNEKKQEYSNTPLHNWASHPADSFRYFAVDFDSKKLTVKNQVINVKRTNGLMGS